MKILCLLGTALLLALPVCAAGGESENDGGKTEDVWEGEKCLILLDEYPKFRDFQRVTSREELRKKETELQKQNQSFVVVPRSFQLGKDLGFTLVLAACAESNLKFENQNCRPGLEPFFYTKCYVDSAPEQPFAGTWDELVEKRKEIQRQKQWLEVTPGAIRVGESVTVRRYAENESSVPFSVTKSGKPAVLTCLLEEKYAIQIPQKEPVQPSDDVKLTIAPGETVLVGEYVFQVPKPEDSASPFWEFIRENVSKDPIVCRLFLGDTQTRGVDLTFLSAPPPSKNEKFREIRENALNE